MTLLKILLFALALLPDETHWQRIHTQQGISFSFPNYPQKLERLVGGIPSVIYQTKDLTCVAGVVCSDLSSRKIELTNEHARVLYEELKAGTVGQEGVTLKNETNIPDDRMFIYEIAYTTFKDNYQMTYFKRIIFRENYIYQITIGGRTRHLDIIQREKEIFFNSVSFQENNPPDGQIKNEENTGNNK